MEFAGIIGEVVNFTVNVTRRTSQHARSASARANRHFSLQRPVRPSTGVNPETDSGHGAEPFPFHETNAIELEELEEWQIGTAPRTLLIECNNCITQTFERLPAGTTEYEDLGLFTTCQSSAKGAYQPEETTSAAPRRANSILGPHGIISAEAAAAAGPSKPPRRRRKQNLACPWEENEPEQRQPNPLTAMRMERQESREDLLPPGSVRSANTSVYREAFGEGEQFGGWAETERSPTFMDLAAATVKDKSFWEEVCIACCMRGDGPAEG